MEKMMISANVLWVLGLLVPVAGAIIGIRAATIEVRDNIDAFIGDIRRQSRWATYAAVASCLGTVLSAFANWH
jgi:hypothetical protein